MSHAGCRFEKLRVESRARPAGAVLTPGRLSVPPKTVLGKNMHLSIVLGESGASQPLGGFDIPLSRFLHYVFGQLGGRWLVVPLL